MSSRLSTIKRPFGTSATLPLGQLQSSRTPATIRSVADGASAAAEDFSRGARPGRDGVDGKDGQNGQNGRDGEPGKASAINAAFTVSTDPPPAAGGQDGDVWFQITP